MNLRSLRTRGVLFFVVGLIVVAILQNVLTAEETPKFNPSVQYDITTDGKPVIFNDDMGWPWLSDQDRTMVPLRIITENMGYVVSWNPITKTATITNGSDTVDITIGKNVAIKNGKQVYIDTKDGKPVDTKAVLISGRTYVPIRFVSEAMGADVGYSRLESNGVVTHVIPITTGAVVPPAPTPGTDPTFDPVADVMPDGRLTKEKTTEYIEEMIEGTTLKKENGKYVLEFERPAIAEGYTTGVYLTVKRHTALGYDLTTNDAYLPHNQLPKNQSFVKELDPERMSDVYFYKFTLTVHKDGAGSTAYYIWYWPENGRSEYVQVNEYGHKGDYKDFNKDRLFEGL